ncbi:hypothetical protein Sru01_42120 [Sphaerisporangium rufum]|uniref:Uncharacterized protein n=1 Tax=Sphaerisporangium rufum TaxID=1381558 RepID=A0A919V6C8_9ACTN|nr:hypothetical protein Sru01_42120 [Sphaerisporangium rufum]
MELGAHQPVLEVAITLVSATARRRLSSKKSGRYDPDRSRGTASSMNPAPVSRGLLR